MISWASWPFRSDSSRVFHVGFTQISDNTVLVTLTLLAWHFISKMGIKEVINDIYKPHGKRKCPRSRCRLSFGFVSCPLFHSQTVGCNSKVVWVRGGLHFCSFILWVRSKIFRMCVHMCNLYREKGKRNMHEFLLLHTRIKVAKSERKLPSLAQTWKFDYFGVVQLVSCATSRFLKFAFCPQRCKFLHTPCFLLFSI